MRVKVAIEVEIPDGATHYLGLIHEDPVWYKHQTNSTGVISGWYRYDKKREEWMWHGERKLHWLKEIERV